MNVSLDAMRAEMPRLIARLGDAAAQEALVAAVANRVLPQDEATQIADEFFPEG